MNKLVSLWQNFLKTFLFLIILLNFFTNILKGLVCNPILILSPMKPHFLMKKVCFRWEHPLSTYAFCAKIFKIDDYHFKMKILKKRIFGKFHCVSQENKIVSSVKDDTDTKKRYGRTDRLDCLRHLKNWKIYFTQVKKRWKLEPND